MKGKYIHSSVGHFQQLHLDQNSSVEGKMACITHIPDKRYALRATYSINHHFSELMTMVMMLSSLMLMIIINV